MSQISKGNFKFQIFQRWGHVLYLGPCKEIKIKFHHIPKQGIYCKVSRGYFEVTQNIHILRGLSRALLRSKRKFEVASFVRLTKWPMAKNANHFFSTTSRRERVRATKRRSQCGFFYSNIITVEVKGGCSKVYDVVSFGHELDAAHFSFFHKVTGSARNSWAAGKQSNSAKQWRPKDLRQQSWPKSGDQFKPIIRSWRKS